MSHDYLPEHERSGDYAESRRDLADQRRKEGRESMGARHYIDHGLPGSPETYQPKTHQGRLFESAIQRPEETVDDPFREQYRRRSTE